VLAVTELPRQYPVRLLLTQVVAEVEAILVLRQRVVPVAQAVAVPGLEIVALVVLLERLIPAVAVAAQVRRLGT
jgi:hypothetical protein